MNIKDLNINTVTKRKEIHNNSSLNPSQNDWIYTIKIRKAQWNPIRIMIMKPKKYLLLCRNTKTIFRRGRFRLWMIILKKINERWINLLSNQENIKGQTQTRKTLGKIRYSQATRGSKWWIKMKQIRITGESTRESLARIVMFKLEKKFR
jgi:hypothetical protein